MDEEAMNSSAVVEVVMKNYVPIKIDTDLSQNNGLLKTYRIIGTPAFVVLDRDERIIAQTLGYMSEEEFLAFLRRGLDVEGR
jgi:thioredoxin-related protein